MKNRFVNLKLTAISLSLMIAVLAFIPFSSYAQQTADIKFEQMDHNFGKIKELGGPADYEFKFTNTGKVPLIIAMVNTSCGCTTPEYSKEPVLPGKTGFIKVSFNPEFRPGVFTKSITVNANIPRSIAVLTISGEVIPKDFKIEDTYPIDYGKLRLKSNELSLFKVKENENKTDTLHFYNPGTTQVTVGVGQLPPFIYIKTPTVVVPPRSDGNLIIVFKGDKKPSYGFISTNIALTINGESKPSYILKVTATVEEDFSKLSSSELANAPKIEFSSKTFDFGEIKAGKKVDYTIKILNKGKRDLQIRNLTATCECITARSSATTIPSGGSTDLKVTFDSTGKFGTQNKLITIVSNDPEHSTTVLRVAGSVLK